MKFPVFLLLFFLSLKSYSQSILVKIEGESDKILQACLILKNNSPEIYEAIVQHSVIQKHLGSTPLSSTCYFDEENDLLWILLGEKNISDRSIYRLAGTIYHESLHLLFTLDRKRNGKEYNFSKLSPDIRKQEEIFVYKKTRELLAKIGTPSWELLEYDQMIEGAKNKKY